MTMTAAELHALAEPLFKAWPACRPKDGEFSLERAMCQAGGELYWRWARHEGGRLRHSEGVDDASAAALIRVSIENELLRETGSCELFNGWIECVVGDKHRSFQGEDLLKSLIAAALAVAESRKATTP